MHICSHKFLFPINMNVNENLLSINFIEILFLTRKIFKVIEQKIKNIRELKNSNIYKASFR